MSDNLQEGIYFRHGERPGNCWRLLMLNVADNTTPKGARAAIDKVWAMLTRLRQGIVDDLNPAQPRPDDPSPVTVPSGNLTCLIGYGARLFSSSAHPLPLIRNVPRPRFLTAFRTVGTNTPFRSLNWAQPEDRQHQDTDIVIQFIADTELAVNRAIVEVSKLIAEQGLPLRIVTFFAGFNRDDRRSWIDFHDGVNTMTPDQRQVVIELLNDTDAPWLLGGTFLAFLRCEADLSAWRGLPREQQEFMVGRDKLTGCPLVSVTTLADGTQIGEKMAGCPMTGTIPSPPPQGYIDPVTPADPLLRASHIHRANVNRTADPREPSANRVYRQGYEFLECRADGRLALGLNFVSFQFDPKRVTDILNRAPEWLGPVNFGGNPPSARVLSLLAGGYYAVPPKGEPFPGAGLFD
jgi:deferrochelatase/peroxidase EfeB